jgi:hypothetical protein
MGAIRVIARFAKLAVCTFCATMPLRVAAQSDAAAMDALLGPIALYPDALLAQVLTASTSPDQVKEFNTWLKSQTLKGSELQQAATDEGFEASFASLALFPEVVSTLAANLDWTKEVGTAYLSDAEEVMASIQRLRKKAQDAGNLKSNEQQTVSAENSGGTQTIVVQPTNPQVVYVPQYDPQVVYAPPPPQQSNAALTGLIAFAAGIAIGAAIDNDPYYYGPHGWGAWGMGWHGGAVVYRRSAWVVPVRPRYPYVRPVAGYRPNRTVVAPRRTNVTVNVNRNKVNVGNQVNVGNRTTNVNRANVSKGDVNRSSAAGNRAPAGGNRATTADQTPNTANRSTSTRSPNAGAGTKATTADRGRDAAPSAKAASARTNESHKTAMGSYGNGSSTKAASNRGKASASKSKAQKR